MMDHLQKAFAFDIHVRRDVDEKFSKDGIMVSSTEITQGIVFQRDRVTAPPFWSITGRLNLPSGIASITADTQW